MTRTLTAFRGDTFMASGPEADVTTALRAAGVGPNADGILIFDHATGRAVDLNLTDQPQPGRGRPKLGVASREVTLLPRQWDWLKQQRGGASATMRRLVDAAMAEDKGGNPDAAYHVMSALCGDKPGFEEASRALFAGDAAGFSEKTRDWPTDITAFLIRLWQGET